MIKWSSLDFSDMGKAERHELLVRILAESLSKDFPEHDGFLSISPEELKLRFRFGMMFGNSTLSEPMLAELIIMAETDFYAWKLVQSIAVNLLKSTASCQSRSKMGPRAGVKLGHVG